MWKQPPGSTELAVPVEDSCSSDQLRLSYAEAEAAWLFVEEEPAEEEELFEDPDLPEAPELFEDPDEDVAELSEEALELEVSAELELDRESVR